MLFLFTPSPCSASRRLYSLSPFQFFFLRYWALHSHCHRWACKKYIHIVNLLLNNVHCRLRTFRCCRVCSFPLCALSPALRDIVCLVCRRNSFAVVLFSFLDDVCVHIMLMFVIHVCAYNFIGSMCILGTWCVPTLGSNPTNSGYSLSQYAFRLFPWTSIMLAIMTV